MLIFSKEPEGKVYEELIDVVAELCDEFILVNRGGRDLSENAEKLLNELDSCKIKVKKQSSWTGTTLLRSHANVYYYRLNDISKEILKKYAKSLYSWSHPILLEDLCFLNKNEKPFIINIAHEQFSYIDSSTKEQLAKLKSIKGIKLKSIKVTR